MSGRPSPRRPLGFHQAATNEGQRRRAQRRIHQEAREQVDPQQTATRRIIPQRTSSLQNAPQPDAPQQTMPQQTSPQRTAPLQAAANGAVTMHPPRSMRSATREEDALHNLGISGTSTRQARQTLPPASFDQTIGPRSNPSTEANTQQPQRSMSQAEVTENVSRVRASSDFWRHRRPDLFRLRDMTDTGAVRARFAIESSISASIRARNPLPRNNGPDTGLINDDRSSAAMDTHIPLPRTSQTGPNTRALFPRTTQTSSDNPANPRVPMTASYDRSNRRVVIRTTQMDDVMAAVDRRLRGVLEMKIKNFVDGLRTYATDSNPEASRTKTTVEKRKERLVEDCAISGDAIEKACETVCGHVFDVECFARAWFEKQICPPCRTELEQRGVHLLEG